MVSVKEWFSYILRVHVGLLGFHPCHYYICFTHLCAASMGSLSSCTDVWEWYKLVFRLQVRKILCSDNQNNFAGLFGERGHQGKNKPKLFLSYLLANAGITGRLCFFLPKPH